MPMGSMSPQLSPGGGMKSIAQLVEAADKRNVETMQYSGHSNEMRLQNSYQDEPNADINQN